MQIPISFGPVVIYSNISPEFHQDSTLQLTAQVAAGIFQGNIKTWDDPAILAINPNLTYGPIQTPSAQSSYEDPVTCIMFKVLAVVVCVALPVLVHLQHKEVHCLLTPFNPYISIHLQCGRMS